MKSLRLYIAIISIFFFTVTAHSLERERYYINKILISDSNNDVKYSINDQPPWIEMEYRAVAFDANGNIYALGNDHVGIFNENGVLQKKVDFPRSEAHMYYFTDGLFVSKDGSNIVAYVNDTAYVYDSNRDLIETTNKWDSITYKSLIKYPVGDSRSIYDKAGNSYVLSGGGEIARYSEEDEKLWTKKFGDLYGLINVDIEGNVYALNMYQTSILKVDINGNKVAEMPVSSMLSKSILEHIDRDFRASLFYFNVTSDGDIYQYVDFSIFSKEAFVNWLKDGGNYYVVKYEKDRAYNFKEELLSVVSKVFKENEYIGNTTIYDADYLNNILIGSLDSFQEPSEETKKMFYKVSRNEIFARHGREFRSEDLKQIFEATEWYKPDPNYSDDMLNDIEKKNVQFILDYEKKMGWR
jgi:hypothetical protein